MLLVSVCETTHVPCLYPLGVGYLFGIFAGISLALLVFIVTLVPETKGVSLSSSGVAEEGKELLADEDEEQPSEDWS